MNKWYEYRPEREAKCKTLERQATQLIRAAKPKKAIRPKVASSPPTTSGWFPLADLKRVLREKAIEKNERA